MTTCARLLPACWTSPRRSRWSGRSTTRTCLPRRSADLGEVRSTARVARRAEGTMIKVGVLGAKGRMGSEVSRTVGAAPDLELAAAVDVGDARDPLAGCDVVVDFTHPGAVMDNLRWCLEHGRSVVVGTSGFGDARLAEVRDWLG